MGYSDGYDWRCYKFLLQRFVPALDIQINNKLTIAKPIYTQ